MLRRIVPFLMLLAGLVSSRAPAAPAAEEVRVWTSRAGSEFHGSLQEIRGRTAVLKDRQGKEKAVPLEQLSAEDHRYLRRFENERHEAELAFYRAGIYDEADLPAKADIKGVRHVVQRENYCVPASAEMVLRFYGYSRDQDDLAALTSRDSRRSAGTDAGQLVHGLRNLGIDGVALRVRGEDGEKSRARKMMAGIRAALAAERPVLLSYETSQLGHMVAAVGYDDRRRAFWVMDPAAGSSPQRLDYKVLESILTGAVVLVPRPAASASLSEWDGAERREFLRTISGVLRSTDPARLAEAVQKLRTEDIPARWRNANRADLARSQGQTRSFARKHGVEFVRLALEKGAVLAAPQQFEEGDGLVLIYGRSDRGFQAVEYLPGGRVHKSTIRPLDFSLRWIWREQKDYLLPLLEIDPPRL